MVGHRFKHAFFICDGFSFLRESIVTVYNLDRDLEVSYGSERTSTMVP